MRRRFAAPIAVLVVASLGSAHEPEPIAHETNATVNGLGRALQDSDPIVREATIDRLAALGGPESARALAVALDDDRLSIRLRAVEALGEIGNASAENKLLRVARRRTGPVALAAGDVLLELLARAERD